MKFIKVEFAPLNVPLQRRMQTFAIATTMFLLITSLILSPIISYLLIFHTKLWWLYCLYLFWCYFIDTDPCASSERRSIWFQNFKWWKYAKEYFPVNLKTGHKELHADRNYLFCCFPHGLLGCGFGFTFANNVEELRKYFPHHLFYFHTLNLNFKLPIAREFYYWLGYLPTSKKCLDYVLGKPGGGNASCLLVGGAAEALHFNPGKHKIVLKNRKGFIKVALKNGCSLVPVYGFGQNEIYEQFELDARSFVKKFQNLFKKITGISVVFFKGRGIFQYTFGFAPYRRPINIVGECHWIQIFMTSE